MGAALQPFAPNRVPDRKTERVLKLMPIDVSLGAADAVVTLFHDLAVEHCSQEMLQRLRTLWLNNPQAAANIDPNAHSEEEFLARNVNNAALRTAAQIPSYERYTFLAPTSSVQFDSCDFTLADLPKDVHTITIRSDGFNGKFLEMRMRSIFKDFNEVRNSQLNQIVVHGDTTDWVNATHERIRSVVQPQLLKTRGLVYGNSLTLFWISFVLLLFAEYRIAKLLYPRFSLAAPLSGTGALVMYGVLVGSLLVLGNTVISAFSYVFPYFEIDGNLSRSRTATRKVVAGIVSTLYVAAVINLLSLVFGSALRRLFGG